MSILFALRRDATQTLLGHTDTPVEWDTEDKDTHNLWTPLLPAEIRIPATGLYNLQVNIAGTAITVGSVAYFHINGATPFYLAEGQGTCFSIGNSMIAGSMTAYLQKDDIIKILAFSNAGGTIQARLGGFGLLK